MTKSKKCAGCGAALGGDDDRDFGWCRDCYFGGKFHERTNPKLAAALRALRQIPGVRSADLEHTGGNNWWLMVRFAGVDDVEGHPAGRHVIAWEAIKLRDTRAWEMETGVPGLNGRWTAMLYSSKAQFEAGQGGGGSAELKPGATTAQLLAFVKQHARAVGKARRAATDDRCPGRMMAGARHVKCGTCLRIDHEKNEGDRCTHPARPAGWRPAAHVGTGSLAAQVLKLTRKGG